VELKHDQQADAIYIYFNRKPYACGRDLDDQRRVDYAADNTPIGIELLGVSSGVDTEGLPYAEEVAELLGKEGIVVYAAAVVELDKAYPSVTLVFFDFDIQAGEEGYEAPHVEPEEDWKWTSTSHSFAITPK